MYDDAGRIGQRQLRGNCSVLPRRTGSPYTISRRVSRGQVGQPPHMSLESTGPHSMLWRALSRSSGPRPGTHGRGESCRELWHTRLGNNDIIVHRQLFRLQPTEEPCSAPCKGYTTTNNNIRKYNNTVGGVQETLAEDCTTW